MTTNTAFRCAFHQYAGNRGSAESASSMMSRPAGRPPAPEVQPVSSHHAHHRLFALLNGRPTRCLGGLFGRPPHLYPQLLPAVPRALYCIRLIWLARHAHRQLPDPCSCRCQRTAARCLAASLPCISASLAPTFIYVPGSDDSPNHGILLLLSRLTAIPLLVDWSSGYGTVPLP